MNVCPNCGMKETRTLRGYAEYECFTSVPTIHTPNPTRTQTCIYVGSLLKRALDAEKQCSSMELNQKEIERKFSKLCKRTFTHCCDECPLEFTIGKEGDTTKCMAGIKADKQNTL